LQTNAAIFHTTFGVSDYTSHNPVGVRTAGTLNAEAGSQIDISGASDTFDEPDANNQFAPTPEWSNAGPINLQNRGTLTGALLAAHGGAPEALGGTLIVLDPTLYQTDPGVATLNAVSAQMISESGFDTLEALGSVTSSGDVTLDLGRAFVLATRPYG